jgi:hypothetical protein
MGRPVGVQRILWVFWLDKAIKDSNRQLVKHETHSAREDEMTKKLLILVVLTLCFTGSAIAQQTETFNGRFDVVLAEPKLVSFSPPTWFILAQGSGEAIPIAHFTITVPHTVNLLTLHLAGNWFLTLAGNDGDDVIMIDLDEQCQFTSPTTAACSGTGTISSGTGTYTNAIGSISIRVDINLATLTASSTFDGTITRKLRMTGIGHE